MSEILLVRLERDCRGGRFAGNVEDGFQAEVIGIADVCSWDALREADVAGDGSKMALCGWGEGYR